MVNTVIESERGGKQFADSWPMEEGRPESDPTIEPEDGSDLEFEEMPCTDDSRWEAFIPDEDEFDPLPDPGDFWIENHQ